MHYGDLRVYRGPLSACSNCERQFRGGEVFTLADGGKLAFCYSDVEGGCLQTYLFFKLRPARMLFGEAQVFRGFTADAPLARPDPPPTLGQRFLRLFGFGRSSS